MNRELKAQIIRAYGTQFMFARVLGIRESTVSAVVQNRKVLDATTQQEWARALNAPAQRLFPQEAEAHV